jgi:hypothetical protein
VSQLWEWTGVPNYGGKPVEYQTIGPDVSQSAMLEHLKVSYRNLTITALRRCEPREAKQSTGRVDRRAFQFGYWDAAMRELGLMAPEAKQSLRDKFNRDRALNIAGITRENAGPYIPIRNRIATLARR